MNWNSPRHYFDRAAAPPRAGLPQARKGRAEITSSQNLRRIVNLRLRIGSAAIGTPNCALFKVVTHPVKTARLSTFVASIRKSKKSRGLGRNVRASDASKPNGFGPMIVFLPAVPHSPATGGVYAA